MKKSIIHTTIFCIIVLGNSCTQKFEPTPLTFTQLLSGTESKTWVLSSAKIIDSKNESPDIKGSDLLDPCELDDQFVFYANEEKKLEYKNGGSKCTNTEPDLLITDSWELLQGSAELDMGIPRLFGNSKLPFIVKSLTSSAMTLEYYFGDIDASYRFTFVSSGK
jgi:hypothetical protein